MEMETRDYNPDGVINNTELGKLVLKQVTEFPETHNQLHWMSVSSTPNIDQLSLTELPSACGTTMCIAGHTVAMAGMTLHPSQGLEWDYDEEGDLRHLCRRLDGSTIGRNVIADYCSDPEGNEYEVPAKARELLGMTKGDSLELFHNYNKFASVELLKQYIKNGE